MAEKKPRILQNNKDMAWSLIPLLLACLVIAAIAGQCSLRVGGPEAGQVPRIDLGASLQADADALDFPIRRPEVPAEWIPNSASRPAVTGADAVASTVGFVTPAGSYLGLTQSDAGEEELLRFRADGARTDGQGVESTAGTEWVVYRGEDTEPFWIADLGESRALITGSGSQDEFLTLASAVASAPVLDPR
ncbi:DUF4245 domain-containing protein [Rhodococcoides corynebacterioides]|uniref:DUF4245 domain-containing protein n=1 Tax=Rhodococcoides corynebacterioides TaxID=53972 RepID=A0ABS7P313_9NOCA|nr:DUF4245 domain-containing protein [Rhodococcus corynebacterioides]MBY6365586.1 DUF4245 domain-containing protein [Rhodococcus corynebacterioides]MBY6406317.1 DUF4245 domain-containing protein [Rhodococcus corynebacterioides]